jgi:DNA sulfur modification protein DndE
MLVKQIRLSNTAKDQLIRVKARTGIQQWNVLCRWALCLSLREPNVPVSMEIPADSNVEMTWHVFVGEFSEAIEGLVRWRCALDGWPSTDGEIAKCFRLHLHRGISYLASPNQVRSLPDLIRLAVEEGADAGLP